MFVSAEWKLGREVGNNVVGALLCMWEATVAVISINYNVRTLQSKNVSRNQPNASKTGIMKTAYHMLLFVPLWIGISLPIQRKLMYCRIVYLESLDYMTCGKYPGRVNDTAATEVRDSRQEIAQ
jgi:hypothetical protein